MNFWRKYARPQNDMSTRLKHEFVIGPQRHSELFQRAARLYFCIRCKSRFLVCKNTVVVLDQNESPIAGEEGLRQFNTFEEGPCPVLSALAQAAPAYAYGVKLRLRRKDDERRYLAPSHIPAWSGRPRPLLRVLTRMRADLGR